MNSHTDGIVIYDTCAPVAGIMARYDHRDEAITAAARDHSHLHAEEDANGPGVVYFECNDTACGGGAAAQRRRAMDSQTTINAALVATINRIITEWNEADTRARNLFHGWEQRAVRAGLERGAMRQIGAEADRLGETFGAPEDTMTETLGEIAFRAYKSGAAIIARDSVSR